MSSTENDQLHIRVEALDDRWVIDLDGELDPHTAPLLQRELDRALAMGANRVILELEGLRFIDSSGLRVLVSAHRLLAGREGTLVLAHPTETTSRLLEITGLLDRLEIEDGR